MTADQMVGKIRQDLADHDIPESYVILAGLLWEELAKMSGAFTVAVLADLLPNLCMEQDARQQIRRSMQ